jgi:hypothetical protein
VFRVTSFYATNCISTNGFDPDLYTDPSIDKDTLSYTWSKFALSMTSDNIVSVSKLKVGNMKIFKKLSLSNTK